MMIIMPLALSQLPILMFLIGCALLTTILLRRSYRYFGRGRSQQIQSPLEKQPRPATKWSGVERDSLAQIDRQEVEMHDMSRDISGQLNSKIIVLEQLIATSQRQIERLEKLLEESRVESHSVE